MDPRSAPERVGDTHLANEAANVHRYTWPAAARSGFPAPKGSEAGTVPAQQRLRPYDLQSVQHQSASGDRRVTVTGRASWSASRTLLASASASRPKITSTTAQS